MQCIRPNANEVPLLAGACYVLQKTGCFNWQRKGCNQSSAAGQLMSLRRSLLRSRSAIQMLSLNPCSFIFLQIRSATCA